MKKPHNPDSYYGKTASGYDRLRQSTTGRQREIHAIKRLVRKGPVLDAACGTGAFSNVYRNYGHNIGVDASDEMLAICKRKHPWLAVRKLNLLEPLPFEDQSFETALCVRFFWWMKDGDMQQVMTELRRVSRSLVFSIRIGPTYGRPENGRRKALDHTPEQLLRGLGSWKVTDDMVIAGNYRMMRAIP